MAVPAHAERLGACCWLDLEITPVLEGANAALALLTQKTVHINSGLCLDKAAAIEKMVAFIGKAEGVEMKKSPIVFATGFLSRQRYWGVSRTQSFIGKMALQRQFQKANCHFCPCL